MDNNVEEIKKALEEQQTVEAPKETKPTPKGLTSGDRRRIRDQQEYFARMISNERKKQAKRRAKLMAEVRLLRKLIGDEDFKNLKDICTIHTPEKKNDKGEVLQKASSIINYQALVVEARLVLALRREQRILSGKRKRSTGRSSNRKTHKSTIRFIEQRSEETIKSGEPLETV